MSDFYRKNVPYTTSTGVKIGLYYSPTPDYAPDFDAQLIQFALINKSPKPSLVKKIICSRWFVWSYVLNATTISTKLQTSYVSEDVLYVDYVK